MTTLRTTFGRWCRQNRVRLRLTQAGLARRAGLARGYIADLETGRANPSLAVVEKVAGALDLEVDWLLRPAVVHEPGQAGDLVHARCSAYVDRRLGRDGLATAREVEIVHARYHGWIDLLAFDHRTSTLIIIEIKTRLDDMGALERQIGWYEREAMSAAKRLGWQPARVVTWLIVLASTEVDDAIRTHRAIFDDSFPVRAEEAMRRLANGEPFPGRVLAMIDPTSRRRDWLIRSRVDGRRTDPPFRDLRDAAARLATPMRRSREP